MGIFRRKENAAADEARTDRLLNGVDQAYTARTGHVGGAASPDLDEFEETVLHAVARDPEAPYPPPGHGYPRR
ncbi:hypothetical protein [Streptomyces spectabilis]|uniref:Putative NADH-flavin reductase n=1 Tax=Streptomyces spectabilis TaxID=68270 RepID=A0A5P2X7V4_STRST|nr:hypothetical protein [Streptomyces spectabilis]MBB5103272.1 putative NADH-flavin reductase [Streptomyces spectabilis]MCI3902463.1 hypothetical protein [Streptomyces spectabilis]QEV59804.1 hypothetical protein CP982_14530 [Streptomyces spectabilis]GGV13714.1 hypothetical protein GCM10010245_23920 [Streptomyces spectabilis]